MVLLITDERNEHNYTVLIRNLWERNRHQAQNFRNNPRVCVCSGVGEDAHWIECLLESQTRRRMEVICSYHEYQMMEEWLVLCSALENI